MSRGRKKVENPENARRILAAAERIFAERGLAGARTDRIAAAARVNKALLYYYFGDKQRLHRAVLEHLFEQLRASIATRADRASPCERLLGFVNGYFDFVSSHPNYPRLIQRAVMESGDELAWIARRYFRPFHRRLAGTINEGIAAGEMRAVDPHHTVLTIIAMTVFYFAAAPVLREILDRDPLRSAAVAARKRAILDFLQHGLLRASGRHG